jgi:uncharacterized membrane protein YbhN (UPF0104 family)
VTRRTKTLVKLAVTVVALGVALWSAGFEKTVKNLRQLDATAWLIAFVAFVIVHGFGTLKWRFFLRLCGGRLSLRDGYRCYAAGLFANLCLPSVIGGDVLRAGLAMTASRQKTAVVLGSLVDRISDCVALVVLATAGFIAAWGPASSNVAAKAGRSNWTPLIVAAAVAAVLLLVAVVAWRRWRPKGKVRLVILEIFVAMRRLKRHVLLAICGLLISLSLQFTLLLVQRELGVRMGMPRDLGVWLFVWPIAKVIAMTPISISGIGVREAAWIELSRPFGIPRDDAFATSVAWQGVLLVGGLIGGLVWNLLTPRPDQPGEPAGRPAT